MLRRPVVRAALAVLGGSSTAAVRSSLHAAAPSDESLSALWGAAIDGMIAVPGAERIAAPNGVLYLAPLPPGAAPPESVEWPKVLAKSAVFALTAHNPMGEAAPAAVNREANRKLQADIASLRPVPRAWWHSFGFSAEEGWREDGFCVAFATDERRFARAQVLKLARAYRQAAIYQFSYKDGVLLREVVWCDPTKQEQAAEAPERMAPLRMPPQSELADVGGAGFIDLQLVKV